MVVRFLHDKALGRALHGVYQKIWQQQITKRALKRDLPDSHAQSGLRIIEVSRSLVCRNALNRGLIWPTTVHQLIIPIIEKVLVCMYVPEKVLVCVYVLTVQFVLTGCALFDEYLPICLQDNEFN